MLLFCGALSSAQNLAPASGYESRRSMTVLHNDGYSVAYDCERLLPAVVWWSLRSSDFCGKPRGSQSYFKSDSRLPKPRAAHKDYTNSKFVRGHMCPAADRKSNRKRFKETFLMSNVVPMTTQANSGAWLQFEAFTRQLTKWYYRVDVVAGIKFQSLSFFQISRHNIAVPDSLWKFVTAYGVDTLRFAICIPNDTVWRNYRDWMISCADSSMYYKRVPKSCSM